MQAVAIDAFKLLRSAAGADCAARVQPLEAKARLRFTVAQALAQGRMQFHFQPVVAAANPARAAFFEMLARVRLPNGELMAAGAFMPMIEDGPLGRAVDRAALATRCGRWRATPGCGSRSTCRRSPWATRSGSPSSARRRAAAAGSAAG